MSFGKRFISSLVTVAFIGTLLVPFVHISPAQAYNQPDKYRQDTLHIKLKNPNDISSTQLKSVLGTAGPVTKIAKLHSKTGNSQLENSLDATLNDYYTVHFSHNVDMNKLVSKLQGDNDVETAYPEAKPAPSPTATPSFISLENYLTPSPNGVNANFARTFPGGTGNKVKLIDVEYSWNVNHEDLSKAKAALVPVYTPQDPFNDNNHGTATIGEVIADKNTYGVTGAAPNAALKLVNVDSVENGYDPVSALYVAALLSKPGDVIMIEQQTWGPNGEFVPIEWIPEIYDMIHAITNSGRVVVEPAGNSGVNLNDPIYGSSFPMGEADSGAIIVGAGLNCSGESRLSRASFSNYGSRVNLQGPGDCVTTTGYGDLYGAGGVNTYYTQSFSGTSSATPVVAAAAVDVSSAWISLNGSALSPLWIRAILMVTSTGQNLSTGTYTGNIGGLPNLASALLITDQTAPSAPTSLKASLNTNKKPVLTWLAATDNYKVSGYNIYRNGVKYATTTSLTFTDKSVTVGKSYSYKVAAVDPSGHISAYSNSISITVH